jgi:hypothetical protein
MRFRGKGPLEARRRGEMCVERWAKNYSPLLTPPGRPRFHDIFAPNGYFADERIMAGSQSTMRASMEDWPKGFARVLSPRGIARFGVTPA